MGNLFQQVKSFLKFLDKESRFLTAPPFLIGTLINLYALLISYYRGKVADKVSTFSLLLV